MEILLVNSPTTVTKKLGGLWIFRVEIHRVCLRKLHCLIGAILPSPLLMIESEGFMASLWGSQASQASVLFVSQMVMNYQVKKRLNCLNASV